MSIPKLIHYVWVGNKMPEKHKNIIARGKEAAVGYEFVLWDENKIFNEIKDDPIEPFAKRAYEEKKYAFFSDSIKLFASKKYGGWAIDADIEVMKPLDKFENYNCVTGFESINYPFTATWGSIPNHKFINLIIQKYYDSEKNIPTTQYSWYSWLTTRTNIAWIGDVIYENGVVKNNEYQYLEKIDVHLFPSYVFCEPKSEKSYTVHYFTGSWV